MELNDKKLKRTTKIINWAIALVLAVFLILLGGNIVSDLSSSVHYPDSDEFVDRQADNKLTQESKALDKQIMALSEKQEGFRAMIDVAGKNKEAEQQSFDNWIKTRNTLGKVHSKILK